MSTVVNERLDKWQKVSDSEQRGNVKKFCEWLNKSEEQIVSEFYSIEKASMLERWKRDYGDYIYQWYKMLLKDYKHNSARSMAYDVATFLRKTCSSVIFETKIPKAVESTLIEHEFTVEQLKRMFVSGDIEERCILQLGVNLMLRVEDFSTLLREPFEKAVREVKEGTATTPYEIKLETGKEKVVAYSQLTQNTVEVLDAYLKAKETSKYLFSENHREHHITERQLNYCLKRLWERTHPEAKKEADNIHWHLLRKYGITVMFNSNIDSVAIRLIVGKTVQIDLKTYLQKVNLSNEFVKVLAFIELGNYIAVQPQTFEQARAREMLMIEAIKSLMDQVEKLTGTRPTVSIPLKQQLPSPKELEELLRNGNSNHS